ncbi:uncharacterized protein LOC144584648 [Pogona vitticeps]
MPSWHRLPGWGRSPGAKTTPASQRFPSPHPNPPAIQSRKGGQRERAPPPPQKKGAQGRSRQGGSRPFLSDREATRQGGGPAVPGGGVASFPARETLPMGVPVPPSEPLPRLSRLPPRRPAGQRNREVVRKEEKAPPRSPPPWKPLRLTGIAGSQWKAAMLEGQPIGTQAGGEKRFLGPAKRRGSLSWLRSRRGRLGRGSCCCCSSPSSPPALPEEGPCEACPPLPPSLRGDPGSPSSLCACEYSHARVWRRGAPARALPSPANQLSPRVPLSHVPRGPTRVSRGLPPFPLLGPGRGGGESSFPDAPSAFLLLAHSRAAPMVGGARS